MKSQKLSTLTTSVDVVSVKFLQNFPHKGNNSSAKRNYNKLPEDGIVVFHQLWQNENIKEHHQKHRLLTIYDSVHRQSHCVCTVGTWIRLKDLGTGNDLC